MMNWYEAKQDAKRERLEERAAKKRREGEARYNSGMERLRAIPFGQPILVGHHSEKRDRNYRAKAVGAIDKGIELQNYAGELEARAAAVGTGGISSDDPEAVVKLKEELATLEAKQAKMVKANRLLRKGDDAGLAEMGYSAPEIAALKTPDYLGRVGYADYETKNNGANIRRIKGRIEMLSKAATRESSERTVGNITIVENTEINRLQFKFPGKPSAAVREVLKGRGFRWSPMEGAWQRQLTGVGSGFADWIVSEIEKVQNVAQDQSAR